MFKYCFSKSVIDYVVVHEIFHITYKYHSVKLFPFVE